MECLFSTITDSDNYTSTGYYGGYCFLRNEHFTVAAPSTAGMTAVNESAGLIVLLMELAPWPRSATAPV